MTGALTLAGDPTANLHAATKQYIDNLLSALGDNLLVDDSASPIPPTDANADKILVRGGRLFENVLHSATDPQVTYRDFATSDLPAGDTWGGAFQVSPSASSTAARTVIYSIPGAHFLVRVAAVAAYGGYSVANWRGPAADKAEADESVTAIGDVVYYGGTVRVVTAFTAGTSRSRSWVPIVTVPAEASVTFDTLAAALLATQAEVASGEADKLATAAIIKAFVEAHLPDLRTLIATNATPAAADRFFFTDENQTDDPLRYSTWFQLASSIVTDDRVLDLAQASRSSTDRGKFLGTSASNENDLVLLDAPSGGGGLNQNQVDARIAPYARATPSGQIADAQIPASITRDTELAAVRTIAEAATTVAEATTIANTRAEVTAGPVIVNTSIASYDATQDRFEDSGGAAVRLVAGTIVLTTQAIYDAAVADSFSFPAGVIFLTR